MRLRTFICGGALLASSSLPALAEAVSFTRIVSSTELRALGAPALNNHGRAAFHGVLGGTDIWSGDGSAFPTLIGFEDPSLGGGPVVNLVGHHVDPSPSINSSGLVALHSSLVRGPDPSVTTDFFIYAGDGRVSGPTPIASTDVLGHTSPFETLGIFPSINNAGEAGFSGTSSATGERGIFLGGASNFTLHDSTGPFDFFDDPALNNANPSQVAFRATLDPMGPAGTILCFAQYGFTSPR